MSHPEANMNGGPGVSPERPLPFTSLELRSWQQFYRWREGRFQDVALVLAPHTRILKHCTSFTD
eukprot:9414589-Pyramimonas_sp.AAC.1